MSLDTIKNKIAVISGGTGYVGFEVAKKLADNGMNVAVLYHNKSKDKAEEMLLELKGDKHKAYSCDLSKEGDVAKTIDTITKEMGNIYACVHAAGVVPKPKQLHLSSLEDLHSQFDVNVFGSFNFLSACARRLKEQKDGVIIGITTAGVVTQTGTKARGAYSAVKFALQGMLVALKEELAQSGVRVYSVAPGVMEGGMNSATPKAFIEMVKFGSPTKTITNAQEVAEKVGYLCSDQAKDVRELTFLIAPETGLI